MTAQEKILEAFYEKPTVFKISVSDNSMLPDDLKDNNEIEFVLKPPVLSVLSKAGLTMAKIPDDLKQPGSIVSLEKASKYIIEMATAFSILAYGKTSDFPNWWVEFLIHNVTPKELFQLFSEAALKTQSSFFLNSIQIAEAINPMTLKP